MEISVVLPTHNPDAGRLRRTLAGLRAQTLPADRWETVLVDNASAVPVAADAGAGSAPANLRIVAEPTLGLTAARGRGLQESRAPVTVFVDDDNVLASNYLENVRRLFAAHPRLGAIGGKSLPEFERPPEPWQDEFLALLALRDLGDQPRLAQSPPGTGASLEYPVNSAPIGAGMAIRREAAGEWMQAAGASMSDRRGGELTSGGDNEIVLVLLEHGWDVGYFPELQLTHLIPAGRLEAGYLARLNRGIQKSWVQVLARHRASPWPPIPRWSVPLRQGKAWFACRAWSGPAGYVRWQGACGHFEGRTIS